MSTPTPSNESPDFQSDTDWQAVWVRTLRDSPYAPRAFEFIRDGLGHTVELIHGDGAGTAAAVHAAQHADLNAGSDTLGSDPVDASRHVSGQQLCLGLRDYAIRRYGMLARVVLSSWGVRTTHDFGHLVFALIDAGLMRKTEEDNLDDFQGVYEFEEEFPLPDEDVGSVPPVASAPGGPAA